MYLIRQISCHINNTVHIFNSTYIMPCNTDKMITIQRAKQIYFIYEFTSY